MLLYVTLPELPAVVVFKDGASFVSDECEDGDLSSWINRARFQGYLHVDGFTLHELGDRESRSQPPATHPLLTPTPETQSSTWHRRSLVLQSQLQALEYFASASSMGLDTNSRVDLTCD
ncbi:uncharacterized protein LOC135189744 isoform X1 [Pogoniulus pusillus]|uniref:uncharacterized protein LOC135173940 isoform X1 n=1 Tax=Pogoniulus pusillus TaxID=488313 RepID=UPI0030B982A2